MNDVGGALQATAQPCRSSSVTGEVGESTIQNAHITGVYPENTEEALSFHFYSFIS